MTTSILAGLVAAAMLAATPAAATAQAPAPSAEAPAVTRLVTTGGEVNAGDRSDGVIWFSFTGGDARFMVRESTLTQPEAFWTALNASAESNTSLFVQYDATTGRFENGQAQPTFIVRTITYGGAEIPGDQVSGDQPPTGRPGDTARARLAEAMARTDAGQLPAAIAAATAALDSGDLDPVLSALALKTRRGAEDYEAFALFQPGLERDRLLVASLDDARAWRRLAPDDSKAAMAEANALRDLGAYDEALALFRALTDRGVSNDIHWGLIRQGAIYRARGDNDRALAMLDELKRKQPEQLGMAYHYHRGTTLIRAGRFADAAAEFTEGLKTEPGYWSALDRRACARARLGHLAEALADLEGAQGFAAEWAGKVTVQMPDMAFNRARRAELIAMVRAAMAKDAKTPVDACGGFWDYGEYRQDRSPLLKPPAG